MPPPLLRRSGKRALSIARRPRAGAAGRFRRRREHIRRRCPPAGSKNRLRPVPFRHRQGNRRRPHGSDPRLFTRPDANGAPATPRCPTRGPSQGRRPGLLSLVYGPALHRNLRTQPDARLVSQTGCRSDRAWSEDAILSRAPNTKTLADTPLIYLTSNNLGYAAGLGNFWKIYSRATMFTSSSSGTRERTRSAAGSAKG